MYVVISFNLSLLSLGCSRGFFWRCWVQFRSWRSVRVECYRPWLTLALRCGPAHADDEVCCEFRKSAPCRGGKLLSGLPPAFVRMSSLPPDHLYSTLVLRGRAVPQVCSFRQECCLSGTAVRTTRLLSSLGLQKYQLSLSWYFSISPESFCWYTSKIPSVNCRKFVCLWFSYVCLMWTLANWKSHVLHVNERVSMLLQLVHHQCSLGGGQAETLMGCVFPMRC